ncbi:hypothetical protein DVH24_035420 [Malus domestica]|uniref:Uncharacterized protein n=1 Tax=Malus domestica TaxID=3750 RepID=A0A498J636_MALDO|nr:hypothetical protein DVH24_035420 [Malus domestica]
MQLSQVKLSFVGTYRYVYDLIQNPTTYGFEHFVLQCGQKHLRAMLAKFKDMPQPERRRIMRCIPPFRRSKCGSRRQTLLKGIFCDSF